MRPLIAPLFALWSCTATASPSTPRSQTEAGFWDHWGDGQAEVVGYRLKQPRYGTLRQGEAVLVFVTETLTHAQRVKSDGGHGDEYPVLKLNEMRDFQTGIYDYHAMTSAFVPLSGELPRGLTSRLTFSMQEWCGHAFSDLRPLHELGIDPKKLEVTRHSYFDGESHGPRTVNLPPGGVMASALPVFVRGLVGDLVAPGQQITVPFLSSILDAHLQHTPMTWQTATIQRSPSPIPHATPLGDMPAWRYDVTPERGASSTWFVQAEAPHRLLGWTKSSGETAEITGFLRTPYWQQSREGMETLRTQLGLPIVSHP